MPRRPLVFDPYIARVGVGVIRASSASSTLAGRGAGEARICCRRVSRRSAFHAIVVGGMLMI
jgi:hypothetical protein